jgi:hypothetical protein
LSAIPREATYQCVKLTAATASQRYPAIVTWVCVGCIVAQDKPRLANPFDQQERWLAEIACKCGGTVNPLAGF